MSGFPHKETQEEEEELEREASWKNMFNSISSFVKTHLVAGGGSQNVNVSSEKTQTISQDLQHPSWTSSSLKQRCGPGKHSAS